GVARRGSICALLTRLKPICNHPSNYLKDWEERALKGRSGKLSRLVEMLEEVLVEGERALIFTQYAEMGELLVDHLSEEFDIDVPFIHGGVPIEQRERIVQEFQEDTDGP